MDNTKNITVLSLCTGYGGLELGLARALANPFRVVAVEVEAYALANLVAKTEEGKLAIEALWPDLRTFPAERFRGCFDFLLAGYPCQGFSVAGKRLGAKDPRHLWPDIARIVSAVRPLWCFFENVPGHLTLGFPDVYCSLRNMAYSVETGLFTAAECGAPHRRQRLFILAHREGERNLPVQQQRQGCGLESGGETVAGSESKRFKTGKQGGNETSRPRLANKSCNDKWPARPGQPQYEWEEPRVVGNTEYTGQGRSWRTAQRFEQGLEMSAKKIESRLGGTVDGSACRVDRLRLLGNGVVPQQAEKAFRCLMKMFEVNQ